MTPAVAHTESRLRTEALLTDNRCDFTAAYLGVKYLDEHARDFPGNVTDETIRALTHILKTDRFNRQKQVFFLFSEAADALVRLATEDRLSYTAHIISALVEMMSRASGKRLRALSQALGQLPVTLPDRETPGDTGGVYPLTVTLDTLIGHLCHGKPAQTSWKGRSLLLTGEHNRVIGVIKFANSHDNIRELAREIWWMDRLNRGCGTGIQLPRPLQIKGSTIFKVNCALPGDAPGILFDNVCIAFVPCPGYYDYPNMHPGRWTEDRLVSVFSKTAAFLGRAARQGIIHTALIPLFHNRTQQGRRNDNGAYLWEHGGRLDQWLDSCRFPNFAASGPRDFEHIISADDSRSLRHYIGEHLLSFILVIGSYFRNKSPLRRGTDSTGTPCDTRDLFCPALFSRLLETTCMTYFDALVDAPWPENFNLPVSDLVQKLIHAMGRDIHMEELLRTGDQERMSDTEFNAFLRDRGVPGGYSRGAADILLDTGPHLGGFNQPISVPELIDCLFRFSALCVAGCFLREKGLDPLKASEAAEIGFSGPSAGLPDESPCCN